MLELKIGMVENDNHSYWNASDIARVEVCWWIFVRNAVKCGEKKFHRVFLTSFRGECGESRRIFFSLHSPQSPHFLQKFTEFTAFLTKIHPKTSTRVPRKHKCCCTVQVWWGWYVCVWRIHRKIPSVRGLVPNELIICLNHFQIALNQQIALFSLFEFCLSFSFSIFWEIQDFVFIPTRHLPKISIETHFKILQVRKYPDVFWPRVVYQDLIATFFHILRINFITGGGGLGF